MPGVYRIKGSPKTIEADAWAAVLWAGEGSALSFGAAARQHGFREYAKAPVEISIARNVRNHQIPFRVHRCDRRLLEHIVMVGGLPVTSIPRTLMDLAGRKDRLAERGLDQMLRENRTTLGELWLLYDLEWTRGRRGIAILRSWLADRSADSAPTDSELEDRLWTLIRRAGDIPLPVRQHPIVIRSGSIRFDFAYPDLLVAIEADSYGWHGDRQAFDRDRRRDAEASILGWIVIRFTWAQIMFDPQYVVDTTRSHLNARLLTVPRYVR